MIRNRPLTLLRPSPLGGGQHGTKGVKASYGGSADGGSAKVHLAKNEVDKTKECR